MYIVSSFEQTIFLEIAVKTLEQKGIRKQQLLAVPLDKRAEERKLFDTIHRADGYSMFDMAAVLGTCGMLLGAIYGFVLTWGPILWGIIGLGLGLIAGFLVKLIFIKQKNSVNTIKHKVTEVFVLIQCTENQVEFIEKVLWDNNALGVAKLFHLDANVPDGKAAGP